MLKKIDKLKNFPHFESSKCPLKKLDSGSGEGQRHRTLMINSINQLV